MTCPAFGKKCNNCNVLNHFSKVCKEKRNVNQVDQVTDFSDGTSSEEESVYGVNFDKVNNVKAKITGK